MANRIRKIKKWLSKIFLAALIGGTLVLVFAALLISDLPNPEEFQSRQVAQSTKMYDRTGTILLYEIHGEEKRTVIPFEAITNQVKWATIAIEDSNFYKNPGFDLRGILRAIFKNFLSGEFSQGGSTITQQLARNAFLSSEKTVTRKIKELIVALELEKRYSKDEILSLYLNQIPYGSNAYGIEAAAQTFFNKSAADLTLPEAALLANLPRATSYYSPYGKHLDELLKRKDLALERMEKLGYISKKEKESAQKIKLEFAPLLSGIKAPHFVIEVQEYLNQKYGEEFVRSAGLRVITTLDWGLQQSAEKIVLDGADRNKELYKGYNSALVAQDAATGQILALVGSKDYFGSPEPENCAPGKDCRFEGNFDVASQGLRQPGSAMKPFAYLAAFKKGYSPDTVIFDLPTEFAADEPDCPLVNIDFSKEAPNPDGGQSPDRGFGKCFHPQNFDEKFRGPVTMRQALGQSINVPAAKTLYLAGIDNLLALAKDFGITTLTERSRYGLSLVLGGGEIILKELVNAYSMLAQEGLKHPQTMILSITDATGNLIEEYKDNPVKVIEPQYPRLINDILTDIDVRAGLFQNSLPLTIFSGHEVALKTGTTNDYRDAWAIGYTPDLVVGVWAGNNDNTPMEKHGSSILAAVPIWSPFMREALKNRPLVPFNKPDPIISPKPMLNKDYIAHYKVGSQEYPQVHEILYYLDKNNPLGPAPARPEQNPQFKNWEDPVLEWAEKNIPNFREQYNQPLPLGAQTESEIAPIAANINITSPKNGGFIIVADKRGLDAELRGSIKVQAEISSQNEISKIQLLFNNEAVDEKNGNFGKSLSYQFNFSPKKIELQNSLKIKVTDSSNNETTKEIILFK